VTCGCGCGAPARIGRVSRARRRMRRIGDPSTSLLASYVAQASSSKTDAMQALQGAAGQAAAAGQPLTSSAQTLINQGVAAASSNPTVQAGTIAAADIQSGNYTGALTQIPGASQYVYEGQAIVGQANADVQTASNVLDAMKSGSTPDPTGEATKKQILELMAGFATAVAVIGGPAMAPIGAAIAAAVDAVVEAVGAAHSGPGVCTTDPPNGPDWNSLRAWPHYVDWNSPTNTRNWAPGSWHEGQDPAGSFQDLANRVIEYNVALLNNCFWTAAIPLPMLLAQLVTAWNASHASSSTAIVSRQLPSGSLGGPTPSFCDPIAAALFDTANPDAGAPMSLVKFTVNTGPALSTAKVVSLRLPPSHPIAQLATAKPAAAAPASSAVPLVAAGALVGAGALFVHASGGVAGALSTLRSVFRR